MKLIKIEKKESLDDFLEKQKYAQFLQSWEWGEFQKGNGFEIFRLGVEENNNLLAVATLIKKNIGLGRYYFYCPRGPIFDEFRISNLEFRKDDIEYFLFQEIEKIGKKEDLIFLRFEPKLKTQNSKLKIIKSIDLQPKKTLILDLGKDEDILLSEMHQKTRYNIRLSQKRGVEITEGGVKDFDYFWDLMNATSQRDEFRIHGKDHYRNLIELSFVKMFFAKYNDNIISVGLFSFFGDTVSYMHGASSNEYRNLMSPFLLQWETVKFAKSSAYKFYDFYGIDGLKWPGVTRFKKGFGGFELEYPGTLDIAYSEIWYNGYKFLRKIRRAV